MPGTRRGILTNPRPFLNSAYPTTNPRNSSSLLMCRKTSLNFFFEQIRGL
jgi:hypothetical protein